MLEDLGFSVEGLGFRVLGFREFEGDGLRVEGLGLRI